MTKSKTTIQAFGLTLCATLFTTVYAQDTVLQENRNRNRANADVRVGVLDSKTTGSSVRVSKLIGMNIENSQEKNIGEIQDIVLNARTGEIQYVAVTYGGFLGLGNKMFAVPFEAIKVQSDPDDRNDADDYILVMDVTKKQLQGAKGFNEENWPNFADETFTGDLYKRYRVKRNRQRRDRIRDVDVRVNRNGVDVDVD